MNPRSLLLTKKVSLMIRPITFLIALLIGTICFAQNGINYKAVINDGAGNIVANQSIVIEFEIEDESTVLYHESHAPTTDENGIIVVIIGEGSIISGDFTDIEWGADNHYLNVSVNTGSGLTATGTSQFKYVPFAKFADIAKTLENPVWLRNGDKISYTNGNVGVGLTNPLNPFSILQANGPNTMKVESQDHPSGKDLLELVIPFDASDNSQFLEMQRGANIVAHIDGDGSAKFKSVQFEDASVQTTAAIGPIAFGSIDEMGGIYSGSGGYSVIWSAASERYEITITGETYGFSTYTTMVTPVSSHVRAVSTTSNDGKLVIYLYNLSNDRTQGKYHFMTFK